MTLSTFRSRWSGGTNASTSTIAISFRESFFQFSIFNPTFLYYTRRTPPLARFFDRLRKTAHLGGFSTLLVCFKLYGDTIL